MATGGLTKEQARQSADSSECSVSRSDSSGANVFGSSKTKDSKGSGFHKGKK